MTNLQIGFRKTIDSSKCAAQYDVAQRVQIADALDSSDAQALLSHLRTIDWRLRMSISGNRYEVCAQSPSARGSAYAPELIELAYQNTVGLSYAYKGTSHSDSMLSDLHTHFNSEEVLNVIRSITATSDLSRASVFATCYEQGHFLSAHEDRHPEKRIAYSLTLPPRWSADWGGILHLLTSDGTICESYTPRFNCLSLFAVPHWHCVSLVAPYAREARFAISGWFY